MARLPLLLLIGLLAARRRRLRLRRRRGGGRRRRGDRHGARPPPTPARPTSSRWSTPGTLTVGTDKPAYPPYFEDDDPANGKGFESAVAYAIARASSASPRTRSSGRSCRSTPPTRPGEKKFDFDINQISITPKRAERVDFSDPYYTAPQAVVSLKTSPTARRHLAGRPRRRQARRPGRHDQPRRRQRADQAVEPAAGVQRLQRHRPRAQDEARGRDRRRPPDRVLPDRGRDPRGEDHRPVRRARRRRLGRRAGQGLRADRRA